MKILKTLSMLSHFNSFLQIQYGIFFLLFLLTDLLSEECEIVI